MGRLNLRISDEVLARLEGMAAEAPPGRAGGVSDVVRRILHDATGVPLPEDPHQRQAAELTGRPNPAHPSRRPRCRACGELAERDERDSETHGWWCPDCSVAILP